MTATLTKKDVARRQLLTAIQLFFHHGDGISIYSLASNAWEVIDVLCTTAGVDSISNQTRDHVPSGRDLKRDYVNSPYRNFFKHADRDCDAVLDNFDESNVDSILMLAVEDYIRMNKRSPAEFQVFQLWYLATHIDKLADAALDKVLRSVEAALPNIRNLPRREQIDMGARLLRESRTDRDFRSDPRTEPSE